MKFLIFGACGRMGREVAAVLQEAGDEAVGVDPAISDPIPPFSGFRAGNFPVFSRMEEVGEADAAIDFSSAEGAASRIRFCADKGVPLAEGTTGLDGSAREELRRAAERIPVMAAENFSRGVHAVKRLAETAQRLLGGFDRAIVERHRRGKKDAPSGTAIMLAERMKGAAIASVRCGDVCGTHELIFSRGDETVTITHTATSRRVFAEGAVCAARWLTRRPAGLYEFDDMVE